MKTNILATALALNALLANAGAPTPREFIIGLSPHAPAAEWPKQQALLQRFLVADAPNASRVIAWDAWELRHIFDVQLPNLAYDSPSARARHLAPALAALKQWFDGLDGKPTPRDLKSSGVIKFPEWVQMAAAQPAPGTRVIVVLASPFYISAEPSFSMAQARYPADGHLTRGVADTPYAPRRGLLPAVEVSWAYANENIWASEHHRYVVTRWWGLWIGAAGGRLVNFSSDAPQVLLTATRTNQRAVGDYALSTADNALVMHTPAERVVPVMGQQAPTALPPTPPPQPMAKSELAPAPAPAAIVAALPPTPQVAPPPAPVEAPPRPQQEPLIKPASQVQTPTPVPTEIPSPALGNIGIAAVWSADRDTDIDLWVAAKPGIPEAYWHRPRVERVRYFRDIRTSQRDRVTIEWHQAWEYVEVERAHIGDPTVWLNVYAASGPVTGIVRVQFDGRIVDRPFQFDVRRGNKGLDSNQPARAHSPYWQEVKLADFFPVGLPQASLKQP
ncbi:MAG: hypothetical protein NT154_10865 [Verrucomicrobia bacterium]|nr:hypothetical protein [Verrucomicrobiota bacterium]